MNVPAFQMTHGVLTEKNKEYEYHTKINWINEMQFFSEVCSRNQFLNLHVLTENNV